MLAPPKQEVGGVKSPHAYVHMHDTPNVQALPPFYELGHVCVVELNVDVSFDIVKDSGRGRVNADALRELLKHLPRERL